MNEQTEQKAPQSDSYFQQALTAGFCKTFLDDVSAAFKAGVQTIATVGNEPEKTEMALALLAERFKLPLVTWDAADGFDCKLPLIPYDTPEGIRFKPREDFKLPALLEMVSAQLAQDYGEEGPALLLQPLAPLRLASLALKDADSGAYAGYGCGGWITVVHNFFPWFSESQRAVQLFETVVRKNILTRFGYDPDPNLKHPANHPPVSRLLYFIQNDYTALDLRALKTVRHWIRFIDFPLPTAEEIDKTLVDSLIKQHREHHEGVQQKKKAKSASHQPVPYAPPSDEYRKALSAAVVGLPRHHAMNAMWEGVTRAGSFSPFVPPAVRRATAEMIAQATPGLEVVPENEIIPPEEIGGVEYVLEALEDAALTATEAARAQFLDPARGIYMLGLPGTGKTVLASTSPLVFRRVTGRAYTLLQVNVSALYGGIVGDTEQNWTRVEKCIKAFEPYVLVFLDEMEKSFSGVMGSDGDSGVRKGLFGNLLTWLGSPSRRCYVMTALNNHEGVPPEFFRRFDAGFFFDTPRASVRIDIFKIHLKKRLAKMGLKLQDLHFTDADWYELADQTHNWLPSEIEKVVQHARTLAFKERETGVPTMDDLLEVIATDRRGTLNALKGEELKLMRALCKHANPTCAAQDEDEDERKTIPVAGRDTIQLPESEND